MIKSSSIPDKVYKFVHKQDAFIQTNIRNRHFSNDWLSIEDNGRIIVKGSHDRGYAWDGCSPKWVFIDITWGTPDGRFDVRTELPITYYSSMFHDVFYQFKADIPLSRKETDIIFKQMLLQTGFKLTGIYYFFVRLFGGFYGKWNTVSGTDQIVVSEVSW